MGANVGQFAAIANQPPEARRETVERCIVATRKAVFTRGE
jgi:hypothetical protein